MKTVLSTLAAAMIASASFAGVALAEGDYYEGVAKPQASANAKVDDVKTAGIVQVRADDNGQSIFGHTSRDNR